MGYKVKPKYPLFLRDVNKNKGSNNGENNNGGGYPVVTVTEDFNIDAKPNTFYNIKNNDSDEININFKAEEFYSTGRDKILLFSFDNVNELTDLLLKVTTQLGVTFKNDTSKEGYKYKSVLDLSSLGYGVATTYAKEYPTTGKNLEVCITNDVIGITDFEMTLTNVVVINENINTIVQAQLFGITGYAVMINEEPNDSSKFNYKYQFYVVGKIVYGYTIDPYPNCNAIYANIYSDDEPDYDDIINVVALPNPIITSDSIHEFLFNVNSPANIIFSDEIKWNNDEEPDLTQTGIYTISILNGVGCYTFVNS